MNGMIDYPAKPRVCEGCSCCYLVTQTFCNISRMDPKDYYYGCYADLTPEECGKEEE